MSEKKKSHDHPLVGLFFLTFENDKKQWQGRVEAVIGEEYVLVQLFSWVDGSPTNMALVTFKDITNGAQRWNFYKHSEDWKEHGSREDRE
jgi:hypothetical protein